MKRLIAILILALMAPLPAHANECENGCYSYSDPRTGKTIEIPYTPEDSQAHANWYQSIVGIPVWNPPIMGDGSIPKPPEGPWVTQDMLPKQPVPTASIEKYRGTQNTQQIQTIIKLQEPITIADVEPLTVSVTPVIKTFVPTQSALTSIIQTEALIIAMEKITNTKKKKKAKNVRNNK